MTDYPSNSQKSKQAPEEAPPTTVKKIIQGGVVQRKKPLGQRLTGYFIGGDARQVGNYALLEVLLPRTKDAMVEAFIQYVERMAFGESRPGSRRSGGGPSSYVNYNRPPGGLQNRRDDQRPMMSQRAKATHDFDEIVLETRGDAEEVIEGLFNLVQQYEQATVADLYGMVGITAEYTDKKYGWTNLVGARVERARGGGYLVDLPKPEVLR